jgi:hypothetical protein
MCALVPRGQTCWRLGLACVGAQRTDYRWRLGFSPAMAANTKKLRSRKKEAHHG